MSARLVSAAIQIQSLERFVDANTAAEFLGITRRTLLQKVRIGKIPGHALDPDARKKDWRFKLSELDHFRHSLASALVKLKCDPKTVQSILPHEDVRTTMQLYVQSDQESKLEAQGKFLELLLGDKADLLTEKVQ